MPGATAKLSRDDAILEILAAVKDGRLEPDEADDLINAWMEVSSTADARRGETGIRVQITDLMWNPPWVPHLLGRG